MQMNLEEAERLAALAEMIDDGCVTCIRNFVERLNETFPDFVWEAIEEDVGLGVTVISSVTVKRA